MRKTTTQTIPIQNTQLISITNEGITPTPRSRSVPAKPASTSEPTWLNQRPILAPGVHVLWRSPTEVQLGINPHRALVMPAKHASKIIQLCDGNTMVSEIAKAAHDEEISEGSIINLLLQLFNSGLIQDSDVHLSGSNSQTVPTQQRLMAQRETQSENARNARFTTEIHIWGLGRLGITIATLLASAGYPLLRFHDDKLVTSDDLIAWGHSWVDVGGRRDVVATQITERLFRGFSERNHFQKYIPQRTLHIYTPDSCADYPWASPDMTTQCMSDDTPHLVAITAGSFASITSVIEPGQTSCWRCMHLTQCDLDASWALVSSQLIDRHVPDVTPIGLVTLAAVHVVSVVGDWLDGRSPLTDVIYEFAWPSVHAQLHEQSAHPRCGCMWDRQIA